jgi:hypothetical protein
MTTPPTNPAAVRQAVQTLDRHSALFRWLYANHDQIAEALSGRPIRWRAFCAWVTEIGLADTNGRPPSERTARETWYQVRRAIARHRAARGDAAARRAAMPSRAPADWQPPPAAPAAPSIGTGAGLAGQPAAAASAGPIDMSAKAQIDRVKARMDRNRL